MSTILMGLFDNKLLCDEREPFLTTRVANLWLGDYQVDFFLPVGEIYVQFGILIILEMVFASALGIVTYRFIVKNPDTVSSYLLAFGVLLPACLVLPFPVIRCLDIRNKFVRFSLLGSVATLTRVLAATFGVAPAYATISEGNMVRHFGYLLELKWDEKTNIPLQVNDVSEKFFYHLIHALFSMGTLIGLFSWMGPLNYQPFDTNVEAHTFTISFDTNHLCNTFLCAGT